MTVDQIFGLIAAEGLTLSMTNLKPVITGGKPSDSLLNILKEHREDIIATLAKGVPAKEPEETRVRCDDCNSTVFDIKGAAYLCREVYCPMRNL